MLVSYNFDARLEYQYIPISKKNSAIVSECVQIPKNL
jgi:hypothetical protein